MDALKIHTLRPRRQYNFSLKQKNRVFFKKPLEIILYLLYNKNIKKYNL